MAMPLLKLLAAIGLTYWLVKSNKLDFNILLESFKHPFTWIVAIVIVCAQITAGAFRWRVILRMFEIKIDFYQAVKVQWIGQFFSTVLPGAVTGDLIKISFLRIPKEKGTTKLLLFSILADRLFALAGLFALVATVGAFHLNDLSTLNPQMGKFMSLVVLLFSIAMIGLVLCLIFRNHIQKFILAYCPEKIMSVYKKIFHNWTPSIKGFFVISIASVVAQVLGVISFIVITHPFLEQAVPFKFMFTIIPIGQLAVVLPISPAGFGVGHVAYGKLFELMGQSNGASLFNIYWFLTTLVSLLGIIPFLRGNKAKEEL